ncbi:MAG: DoxX family protein [Bacteroidota bacterium]
MAKFHETGIPKWQRIIGYILSIIFSFQIFVAGTMKIISNDEMNENMAGLGPMADHILLIGLGELVLLALYWIPKTQKIGFYLMCSFVGGIIATEIIGGRPIFIGISTAILLYAGTIMRNPSQIR